MSEISKKYQAILDRVPDVTPEPYDALPVRKVGICGAHRTGKTTLAKAIADKLNVKFVQIGSTAIFRRNNLEPDQDLTISQRIFIQGKILNHACEIWSHEQSYICDRTPLDMAAYMLAEVQGHTLTNEQRLDVANYLADCQHFTELYFNDLIVIPPAIPLVAADGKAPLCPVYIEHLHRLIVGFYYDRIGDGFMMPLRVTNLKDRIDNVLCYLECK